ncbi:non-heme iron oxygenase ferredoxin subunit [Microbacterium hominis]|uniref:Non-heme iron oxygenase ferredoxin subunit n=1 Tax=Microbacterium hominis TaxID=162426 RepID=A0A7D4TGZ6_9MICO|nr:non-heme iron oxygenase ferredoxin subunit [Microbacterium hominis]QKJ20540.1 non-heme iron oxygenase ferredoxin subunit [Microbacterium hominis]
MQEGIVVASVGDIDEGWAIKVDASVLGTVDDVAVFNDRGEYFALDDSCSHMNGSLSDGYIDAGVVECPNHAGRFCLRDGSVVSEPATEPMATHRVTVEGTEIRVTPNPARIAP